MQALPQQIQIRDWDDSLGQEHRTLERIESLDQLNGAMIHYSNCMTIYDCI